MNTFFFFHKQSEEFGFTYQGKSFLSQKYVGFIVECPDTANQVWDLSAYSRLAREKSTFLNILPY